MYQNNIPPKCSPIDLFVSDKHNDDKNEEVQAEQLQPSDNEIIPTGDCIYDRNDLLAVTIDGHLCLGKVAERVYESSKSCTVLLYREKNGLTFQQEIIRDLIPFWK